MVVKKFGSRCVYLTVNVPANGYAIEWCFVRCKLSVCIVFTHRNLPALVFKNANCLGVIWSSLTGN